MDDELDEFTRRRLATEAARGFDDEAALLDALAQEMERKQNTLFTITMQPQTVLSLAGDLQLALRHPELTGRPATVAQDFLAGVRAYFHDCPAVLEVLRRGDDPREDR